MPKRMLAILGLVGATTAGLVVYWRFFPRAGLEWTNKVFNPWLVANGWSGGGPSELGTIEHIGRRTGTRHLTPVHPVPTPDGFRIVVPLADRSEWAKNVLAAGHCRIQLHDVVYELDEPLLVRPVDCRELSAVTRWAAARLGFKYLRLHRFAEAPGELAPVGSAAASPVDAVVAGPLVSSHTDMVTPAT